MKMFGKKLLAAAVTLAVLLSVCTCLPFSVSAGSAVDENVVLSDLIPPDVDVNFEAQDCEVKIDSDGSMTVTVTGAFPVLRIKLTEGTVLFTGASVNVREPAYLAVDFGTAGEVQFGRMILHYTRKDKDAAGVFADLYLTSMYDEVYKEFCKQMSESRYSAGLRLANGGSYYVVWDWGSYISANDARVFDDGMHRFTDIEIDLTGSAVGSAVTFYTIAVVSDPDVELGGATPDPIQPKGVLGDINGNKTLDSIDYLLLKRAVLGTFTLSEAQKEIADINKDGKINSVDYMLLKRAVLGTYVIG